MNPSGYRFSSLVGRVRRGRDGFPTHTTFGRLGPKAEWPGLLLEHADELELRESVRAICEAEVVEPSPGDKDDPDDPALSLRGFVYLMRMGKHYKIGRSNDPGRRAYEVRLQMPEKVELVHEIETDDPEGIEAYWHRRFADRRAEGEWFTLSREDVRAFRSRQTM